jgi:hypothetical protein
VEEKEAAEDDVFPLLRQARGHTGPVVALCEVDPPTTGSAHRRADSAFGFDAAAVALSGVTMHQLPSQKLMTAAMAAVPSVDEKGALVAGEEVAMAHAKSAAAAIPRGRDGDVPSHRPVYVVTAQGTDDATGLRVWRIDAPAPGRSASTAVPGMSCVARVKLGPAIAPRAVSWSAAHERLFVTTKPRDRVLMFRWHAPGMPGTRTEREAETKRKYGGASVALRDEIELAADGETRSADETSDEVGPLGALVLDGWVRVDTDLPVVCSAPSSWSREPIAIFCGPGTARSARDWLPALTLTSVVAVCVCCA